jgi:hypothetical protein
VALLNNPEELQMVAPINPNRGLEIRHEGQKPIKIGHFLNEA